MGAGAQVALLPVLEEVLLSSLRTFSIPSKPSTSGFATIEVFEKTHAGSTGERQYHMFHSGKQHFGETVFRLTPGFTTLEALENV